MLTPILTVKTATPSAHVTTPEAVLPKEKATAAPATLSGRQSEAALRILETINKQLLGSDMPPKDALVRLLDTLARLLKLPQLPQESLLALSKRIAARWAPSRRAAVAAREPGAVGAVAARK